MAKVVEKVRIPPKEASLKKLAAYGIVFPKNHYITAENAHWMVQHKLGRDKKSETDEQIDIRLRDRFETMGVLVDMAIQGVARSVIISGAPGLGKSYEVEQKLRAYDPQERKHKIIKGVSTPVNIYKSMWDCRHEGFILVLDDCDGVRKTEDGINLMKAATDTMDRRIVSYMSEGTRISEKDNSRIPNSFEFSGTLIFITNDDMDAMSQDDTVLANHMEALMSRGHYCDLTLRTRREAMIRIKQVVGQGLLDDLSETERGKLMEYVEKHKDHFRDLSLRTVIKIKQFMQASPVGWDKLAKNTLIPA